MHNSLESSLTNIYVPRVVAVFALVLWFLPCTNKHVLIQIYVCSVLRVQSGLPCPTVL